jgi:hypothetical protein
MKQESIKNDICCPEFDPLLWDGKILEWNDKKFIKESVFTFFYMPIGFGNAMRKLGSTLARANAENPNGLCLSDHTSVWNMDLYLAVDKEIPAAQNATFNGNFVSKVYEGSFNEIGKWQKDFAAWCNSQGHKIGKQYLWYTTCPKCAKKYGKNYVVLMGKIEK